MSYNERNGRLGLALASAFVGFWASAFGGIELTMPEKDATVALVPDVQKRVMSRMSMEERRGLLDGDKALRKSGEWGKSNPVVLKWAHTEKENGPWKIEIGLAADLSDARVWYVGEKKQGEDAPSRREMEYTVPFANLEIARKYYWRVSGVCLESKDVVLSEISSFYTEDFAPRWIGVEGRVGNIRDLGGRLTHGGRRVKQGMAFRGQGLNDNAVGERRGRNRLMVEDVDYLTHTLGIRTDLDLRVKSEKADMTESPLGPGVAFVQHPSQAYHLIFTDQGKKIMAKNFRIFCDRKNYPIYFHCIGGADRTGTLAYVLNGVLGVDRHDLETDWESTFYSRHQTIPISWFREEAFNDGFSKYGNEGDSWSRRIELYLLDCGITEKEIAEFRSIMLE